MEAYFATMFEDVKHERSLFLLISLTDPDILRQSKFTDHEISIIKDTFRKITRTTNIKRASGFCFT